MKLLKPSICTEMTCWVRLPNDGITVFMLNEKDEWQANGYLDRGDWFNDFDNECPCFPTHWLEEIPDNTQQIEKLEAEKKELLEGLEKVIVIQDKYFGEQEIHSRLRAFCVQIESLIKKHKQ